MAQELAFAAPRAEEMTAIAVEGAGAGITGVVEGVIVQMAPQMGAAAPMLSWGTLLGVPLVGVGGALFARGMIGDLLRGVATAGIGILGYSLPAMLAPAMLAPGMFGRKAPAGGGQGQLGAGNIKQLPAGLGAAPQRAQAGIKSAVEF